MLERGPPQSDYEATLIQSLHPEYRGVGRDYESYASRFHRWTESQTQASHRPRGVAVMTSIPDITTRTAIALEIAIPDLRFYLRVFLYCSLGLVRRGLSFLVYGGEPR